eukprot:8955346-Pyramimonas_sp.AAC.1
MEAAFFLKLSRRRTSSGQGNMCWALWGPPQRDASRGPHLICWNARSILCMGTRKRDVNMRPLSEYTRQRSLIALQAVRLGEL